MNRMIRGICPKLGKALVVGAFALTFLSATSLTAASQESGGAEHRQPNRKANTDLGVRGHGFMAKDGVLTTVDAPGVGAFTAIFGIDDRGATTGGYVDRSGMLHGFIRRNDRFTTVDFPGAKATVLARMNAQGKIVGAYSDDANAPAFKMSRGFLWHNGVFTAIDVPGAKRTQPFGINNQGQIVGEYDDAEGRSHGFLMDQGVVTTIDAPDGAATIASDIDDSGRIVGTFVAAVPDAGLAGVFRGFLRDAAGVFTPIDVPNADPAGGTNAFGINRHGQIVGTWFDASPGVNLSRGFLLKDGVFTTIDAPAATRGTMILDISDSGRLAGVYDITRQGYLQVQRGEFTTIYPPEGSLSGSENGGVNNRGQIASIYRDAEGSFRGFLLDERGFTPIDVPGALTSVAHKINDHGQVVGGYSTLSNESLTPGHGYVWHDGVVTPIDVPGALHTQAFDIDNHSRIVGEYQDAAGIFHGFLRDQKGTFTTVDVPGASATSITAANDRGQMAGAYIDARGAFHASLLDRDVFTTIDIPNATVTLPLGINNQGQVVGIYVLGTTGRGFMLRDGTFTDTTPPTGTLGTWLSTDIDDRGRILGFYE
jgi:probable HAF family extracellular repeat protein